MSSEKEAVLLLNLGSPSACTVKAVRAYLKEFLSDERVLDAHPLVRWLVLHCFILPFRPRRSAEAYQSVWTPEGAPLITGTYRQRALLRQVCNLPIEVAMRYGQPSIEEAIDRFQQAGVTALYAMPLYPHYAMSSYETVVVKVTEAVAERAPQMRVEWLQPFYQDSDYIEALGESAQPALKDDYDCLLFSFHGLPERHLHRSDPSKSYCLKVPDCCFNPHPAHATCYRHQCFATVQKFVQRAGIPKEKYAVSFQSRLGRDPWLTPYTDEEFVRLPKSGVKRLRVICPAFVCDCLETLEEIAIQGKKIFLEAGGISFLQIPCLNDHPLWIRFLQQKVLAWQAKELAR